MTICLSVVLANITFKNMLIFAHIDGFLPCAYTMDRKWVFPTAKIRPEVLSTHLVMLGEFGMTNIRMMTYHMKDSDRMSRDG